nr:FAD synthase-like [Parasteatoda tepidariorum]
MMIIKRLTGNFISKSFSFLRTYPNQLLRNFCSRSQNSPEISAGVLIIGDEILKGEAEDENSSFFIKNLNQSRIKINKISLVPDDVDVIAEEVLSLSRTCTVVLTSGGIGPTHDDVTFEAVAKAFGEKLVQNEELKAIFKEYFASKANQNTAVLKFSSIPESAILNFKTNNDGQKYRFPLISARNVFMFPGVPMLLQRGFKVFKSNFSLQNQPNFVQYLHLNVDEVSITPILNHAVETFKGLVKFGSYPSFINNYYRVKLTMEGADANAVNGAKDFITKSMPKERIVELKNVFKSCISDVSSICKDNAIYSSSFNMVHKLMVHHLSEICICFNGSKDSIALLHLLYTSVQKLEQSNCVRLHALYVKNGETFKEVEEFISSSAKLYNLNLTILNGDFKPIVLKFLETNPQIRVLLMGTRRSDPGAEHLKYFNPEYEQKPVVQFLPLLDWCYSDVWNFIRKLQLPYCVLYDRGYTSLGLKGQTFQNPALLVSSETKIPIYKPAYMLTQN